MSDVSIIKQITNKVLTLIADEINKSETQLLVKNKIIHPVINLYSLLLPFIWQKNCFPKCT